MPRIVAHGGHALLNPYLKPFFAVSKKQDSRRQASTIEPGGFVMVDRVKAIMDGLGHASFRLA